MTESDLQKGPMQQVVFPLLDRSEDCYAGEQTPFKGMTSQFGSFTWTGLPCAMDLPGNDQKQAFSCELGKRR